LRAKGRLEDGLVITHQVPNIVLTIFVDKNPLPERLSTLPPTAVFKHSWFNTLDEEELVLEDCQDFVVQGVFGKVLCFSGYDLVVIDIKGKIKKVIPFLIVDKLTISNLAEVVKYQGDFVSSSYTLICGQYQKRICKLLNGCSIARAFSVKPHDGKGFHQVSGRVLVAGIHKINLAIQSLHSIHNRRNHLKVLYRMFGRNLIKDQVIGNNMWKFLIEDFLHFLNGELDHSSLLEIWQFAEYLDHIGMQGEKIYILVDICCNSWKIFCVFLEKVLQLYSLLGCLIQNSFGDDPFYVFPFDGDNLKPFRDPSKALCFIHVFWIGEDMFLHRPDKHEVRCLGHLPQNP